MYLRPKLFITWHDLVYAIRSLRRSPFLVVSVLLTTALGIGSLTGSFALIDSIFFQELGVKNAREIVSIAGVDATGVERMLPSSTLEGLQRSGAFQTACGFITNLSAIEFADAEPTFPPILEVSGGCFEALGIQPAVGRLINGDDELYGAPPVAVLSFLEWQRRFAANPSVIGLTVRIDGKPFRIVGVTERKFTGLVAGFPAAYIVPAEQFASDAPNERPPYWCWILARLDRGTSLPQSASRLQAIWPNILESTILPVLNPAERRDVVSFRLSVTPGANGIDMQHVLENLFRRPLFMFLFLSSLILLISCVNAAGLLLVRSYERRPDSAIQLALGASRWQIASPLVVESLILQLSGTFLGVPLAYLAIRRLVPTVGSVLTNFKVSTTPDLRVVCFVVLTIITTSFLSVVLPCLKMSAMDIAPLLHFRSRSSTKFHSGFRRVLIVAHVALTFALVGVASSFGESLRNLRQSPGFQIENSLAISLSPVGQGYRGLDPVPYYRGLLSRLESIEGISAAALVSEIPLSGMQNREPVSLAASLSGEQSNSVTSTNSYYVTERYFEVLKIPLIQGRPFLPSSNTSGGNQGLITRSLARKLFPGDEAIGHLISIGGGARHETIEIGGVIADARLSDLHAIDSPIVFLNYWQHPDVLREPTLLLRLAQPSSMVVPSIRQAIRDGGREYPLWIRTLKEQRDQSLLAERMLANSAALFGAVSVLLMTAGIFGVLSFIVSSRLRELAIRIALGSSRKHAFWIVARESLILVFVGALAGIPLLLATLKMVSHFVTEAPHLAPEAMLSSLVILLATTTMASSLPCIRAIRIQPAPILNGE